MQERERENYFKFKMHFVLTFHLKDDDEVIIEGRQR